MAEPFTDNNGTTFHNQNYCRSYSLSATTALQRLENSVCSEVIIINKTGQNVLIYDGNFFDAANRLMLASNDSIVLRGITNSMQVSAQLATGSATGLNLLYYRTQYYSNLPAR